MIKKIEEVLTNVLSVIISASILVFFDAIGKPIPVFPLILSLIIVCNIGKGYEVLKCFSVVIIPRAFSDYCLFPLVFNIAPEWGNTELLSLLGELIAAIVIGFWYQEHHQNRTQ